MERTFIGDLRKHIGEKVCVQGFMQTLRDQKKMQFIILRDLTGLVQIAFWKANDAELAEKISAIGTEAVLTIIGTVVDLSLIHISEPTRPY